VLPDLLATSGDGRLRVVPATAAGDLADGVRLHLATDRRFHAHPAFREATAEASALLRATPFATPPRRVFFLAHVFVEIALDGCVLELQPDIADQLYAVLEAAGPERIAGATRDLLSASQPLPNLAKTIRHFLSARYLGSYSTVDGQAAALHRISRMAGLPGFSEASDRSLLAGAFAAFAPRLPAWKEYFLRPPDGFSAAGPVVQ